MDDVNNFCNKYRFDVVSLKMAIKITFRILMKLSEKCCCKDILKLKDL